MRLLIFLCLGGLLASAAADDIAVVLNYNFEPALKDVAKWKVLFNCYMERGPCGKFQAVRDASVRIYKSKCAKCTSEQKEKFEKFVKRTIELYPNDVAQIINKVS